LPFAICLVLARWLYETQLILALAVLLAGTITLAISYWRCVLPHPLKTSLLRYTRKMFKLTGLKANPEAML
jgi:hypothetical protein